MPYEVYKVMHLLGLFMVFSGVGGMAVAAMLGAPLDKEKKGSWIVGVILHGIGMILVLVGGFGLLARLGFSVAEPWVLIKLFIWIFLGATVVLFKKIPNLAKALFFILPIIGATGGTIALLKPGMSTSAAAKAKEAPAKKVPAKEAPAKEAPAKETPTK